VEQEAADELDWLKSHDADAVVVCRIPPAKAHLAVVETEELPLEMATRWV
jgi:hypothetical protein